MVTVLPSSEVSWRERELRDDLELLVDVEQLVADRREHDAPHIGARERRIEHVRVLGKPDAQWDCAARRSAAERDERGSRREAHGLHGDLPSTLIGRACRPRALAQLYQHRRPARTSVGRANAAIRRSSAGERPVSAGTAATRRQLRASDGRRSHGRRHRDQRRPLDPAALDRMRAAQMQMAAGRRIDRARHVALQDGAVAPRARARHRDRGQQRLRIGVARVGEQFVGRRGLDDAAEIHHGDAVGDVLHHREIVRDEDVGEAEPPLQVAQQVEHLRADRHVERRDRLVAHDQLRLDRERARDHDALALPAGEFVRIARREARLEPDHLAAARATRSRRCAAGTMSCSASGSARMSPTVMRGLSDAYGSWNTSCAWRRIGARAGFARARTRPARRSACGPAVGSIRRSTSRPTVDLPEPDSPTSASVLPASTVKLDAVDRLHMVASRPAEARERRATKCFTSPSASTRAAAHATSLSSGARRQRDQRAAEIDRPAAARRGTPPARTDSGRRSGSRPAARSCRAARRRSRRAGRRADRAAGSRRAARPCRDARGASNSASAGARSTISPAYITATSSHTSATTPRSCVIRMIAASLVRLSSRIRSRICAWMVTSSAVVGSSAISSSGSQASAIAIMTRWRMPPDSLCG